MALTLELGGGGGGEGIVHLLQQPLHLVLHVIHNNNGKNYSGLGDVGLCCDL